MIDSIVVALSGMRGHERGLNVISNNVANLNTPGFRGSKVSFTDVFSGPPFADAQGDPLADRQNLGGGLDASRTRLDTRAGTQQQTGRDLDLFLKGSGFFVLQDEAGATRYSRNGSFDFNADGELVASGQKLKVLARNAAGQLAAVSLNGLRVNPAKVTSEVSLDGILSSGDTEHTIDSLVVIDKSGGQHTLKLVFSKNTGTPPAGVTSSWKVSASEGTQEIGSGELQFDISGVAPGSSPLKLTLALSGTDPVDVSFKVDTVTGVDIGASSTLAVQKQDGLAAGTITAKTFDANGVLKITYSNGQTVDGPKLALADIRDDNALVPIGDTLFSYRGPAPVTLREAGDDLQVLSQSIEASNVDLTQQFSDLILMQRGYQASSQVLSTANDMLQELMDLRGRR